MQAPSPEAEPDTAPTPEPSMRLHIVSHECSPAQADYQKLRVNPGAMSNVFYKDATPRGEHFMRCVVKVTGREHEGEAQRRVIPLKLTLCYDDGQPIEAVDHSSLRILSSNSHLKAAIPANQDHVAFSYRIELGSFRRADRSFAVRVEANADATHRPASYLPQNKCREIESCITPAVYVLSKKKITDAAAHSLALAHPPRGTTSPLVVPGVARTDFGTALNGANSAMSYGLKRKFGDDAFVEGPDHVRLRWSGTGGANNENEDTQAIMLRLNAIESQVSQLTDVITKFAGTVEQLTQQPQNLGVSTTAPLPDQSAASHAATDGQHYYAHASPSSRSVYNVTRLMPPFTDDPPMHQQQGVSLSTQHTIPQSRLHRAAAPAVSC